ncbi:MAG: phosphate signaling complex protein PhoU [Gammaproteobacteria bacterium]
MGDLGFNQHISQRYNAELEDIRNRVLAMGGLVEEQISKALQALNDSDSEIADAVIANDVDVNRLEVELDEECSEILVRRQPAASDLRLVLAVIKTINDLERVGDEAERIARMAVHLAQEGNNTHLVSRPYASLMNMGELVRGVLRDALDAFARVDATAALAVAKRDKEVDREYEAITRQLITFMMEDPRTIGHCLEIMWSARALERIGDHARNICEYVIYLVEGKDIRHTSLDKVEQIVQGSE